MRFVSRRPAAVLLVGVVAAGMAGIAHVATAGALPVARAAEKAPRPPLVRPAKPDASKPVRLQVRLRAGVDEGAGARRMAALSAAETTRVPAKGPDDVVVTVPADRAAATAAKLRADSTVASVRAEELYYASAVEPNDEWFWRQDNFERVGMSVAWDTTTGSSDVIVAVIDTGVSQVSELAGALVPGYDFVNSDADASDDNGPGTMVASLVAGSTDNRSYLAGSCWTCRIMPIKVLSRSGSGYSSHVAKGIDFAVAHQADIINMSLGGEADPLVSAAIARAVKARVTVVAAAGNSGVTKKEYPAASPGVLAVGATDLADGTYPWSNRGADWVDVAAPGVAWMQYIDGEPLQAEGTSFSSPLVAGIAGLILAAHPEATDTEVLNALTSTARPVGPAWRYGRVDAAAALRVLPVTSKAIPSLRVTAPISRHRRVTTTFSLASDARVASVQGFDGAVDLGTDTVAPWSVTWNPDALGGPRLADGTRTLKALVTGTNGAQRAVTFNVILDRTLPRVTGASPGQNYRRRGTVTVTAAGVSDASGVVSAALFADGKQVGVDRTAPYAVSYNLSRRNGPVKLQWRITDRAANVGVFNRVIIADNVGPTVRITSGPKNKAKVKGTVKLTAAASDPSGILRVELLINGRKVGTDTVAPYTFSIPVSKYGKTLKVQVRAYDRPGNLRTDALRTWTR